jgi:hypothetical protein
MGTAITTHLVGLHKAKGYTRVGGIHNAEGKCTITYRKH